MDVSIGELARFDSKPGQKLLKIAAYPNRGISTELDRCVFHRSIAMDDMFGTHRATCSDCQVCIASVIDVEIFSGRHGSRHLPACCLVTRRQATTEREEETRVAFAVTTSSCSHLPCVARPASCAADGHIAQRWRARRNAGYKPCWDM